jgi:hypothetical protein
LVETKIDDVHLASFENPENIHLTILVRKKPELFPWEGFFCLALSIPEEATFVNLNALSCIAFIVGEVERLRGSGRKSPLEELDSVDSIDMALSLFYY